MGEVLGLVVGGELGCGHGGQVDDGVGVGLGFGDAPGVPDPFGEVGVVEVDPALEDPVLGGDGAEMSTKPAADPRRGCGVDPQ